MSLFDTYQAAVGRAQGATTWFIRQDGNLNVGDILGGANGTAITGSQLMRLLLSPMTRTSFTMASAIQTVSVIPTEYGLVNVYYPSATTSVKMPAANKGAMLILQFLAVPSTISLLPGTSGSIAIGYSDMSCVLFSMNGLSGVWAQFMCTTDNEWQIAEISGVPVTAQRSS